MSRLFPTIPLPVRHRSASSMLLCMLLILVGCNPSGEARTGTSAPISDDDDAAAATHVENIEPNATEDSDFNLAQDSNAEVEEPTSQLAVGDAAPDFNIEVLGGEMLRLSELIAQSNRPTILLFNRAHW